MAMQPKIGNIAQIRDTWRQEKIDPNPNTMKIPTLYEKTDMVINIPRNFGSLEEE